MFEVKAEGLNELRKGLNDLEKRQLPFATALALTSTAKDIQAAERKEMERVFDRPTPFTLNSTFVKPATRQKLTALVWLRDWAPKGTAATQYLAPQVYGGRRRTKRFEKAFQRVGILHEGMYAAPGGGASLDPWGNVSRGQIVQMLAYFRAFGEQGYRANMTAAGRKRLARDKKKKGTRGYAYFASRGKGMWFGRQQRLPAGIYKRIETAWGSAVKPVLSFVKEPTYQQRIDFFGVAERTTGARYEENFRNAFLKAMETAR